MSRPANLPPRTECIPVTLHVLAARLFVQPSGLQQRLLYGRHNVKGHFGYFLAHITPSSHDDQVSIGDGTYFLEDVLPKPLTPSQKERYKSGALAYVYYAFSSPNADGFCSGIQHVEFIEKYSTPYHPETNPHGGIINPLGQLWRDMVYAHLAQCEAFWVKNCVYGLPSQYDPRSSPFYVQKLDYIQLDVGIAQHDALPMQHGDPQFKLGLIEMVGVYDQECDAAQDEYANEHTYHEQAGDACNTGTIFIAGSGEDFIYYSTPLCLGPECRADGTTLLCQDDTNVKKNKKKEEKDATAKTTKKKVAGGAKEVVYFDTPEVTKSTLLDPTTLPTPVFLHQQPQDASGAPLPAYRLAKRGNVCLIMFSWDVFDNSFRPVNTTIIAKKKTRKHDELIKEYYNARKERKMEYAYEYKHREFLFDQHPILPPYLEEATNAALPKGILPGDEEENAVENAVDNKKSSDKTNKNNTKKITKIGGVKLNVPKGVVNTKNPVSATKQKSINTSLGTKKTNEAATPATTTPTKPRHNLEPAIPMTFHAFNSQYLTSRITLIKNRDISEDWYPSKHRSAHFQESQREQRQQIVNARKLALQRYYLDDYGVVVDDATMNLALDQEGFGEEYLNTAGLVETDWVVSHHINNVDVSKQLFYTLGVVEEYVFDGGDDRLKVKVTDFTMSNDNLQGTNNQLNEVFNRDLYKAVGSIQEHAPVGTLIWVYYRYINHGFGFADRYEISFERCVKVDIPQLMKDFFNITLPPPPPPTRKTPTTLTIPIDGILWLAVGYQFLKHCNYWFKKIFLSRETAALTTTTPTLEQKPSHGQVPRADQQKQQQQQQQSQQPQQLVPFEEWDSPYFIFPYAPHLYHQTHPNINYNELLENYFEKEKEKEKQKEEEGEGEEKQKQEEEQQLDQDGVVVATTTTTTTTMNNKPPKEQQSDEKCKIIKFTDEVADLLDPHIDYNTRWSWYNYKWLAKKGNILIASCLQVTSHNQDDPCKCFCHGGGGGGDGDGGENNVKDEDHQDNEKEDGDEEKAPCKICCTTLLAAGITPTPSSEYLQLFTNNRNLPPLCSTIFKVDITQWIPDGLDINNQGACVVLKSGEALVDMIQQHENSIDGLLQQMKDAKDKHREQVVGYKEDVMYESPQFDVMLPFFA